MFLFGSALRESMEPKRRKRSRHSKYYREILPDGLSAKPATPRLPFEQQAAAPTRKDDPTRGEIISALKNLGYSVKDSAAAATRASGEGFEKRFKNALGLLRAQ